MGKMSEYKLVGLSKPKSATLEFFDKQESFNVSLEHQSNKLWDYCKNNWDNINLKAVVWHNGFSSNGMPIDIELIEIIPVEEKIFNNG